MAARASDQGKLPLPISLADHFSITAKRRKASQVKKFYKYFQIPGVAQLAGGLPDYRCFPFDTLEAGIATPERYQHKRASGPNSGSSRLVVPKESIDTSDVTSEIDIKTALQYGTAQGYPPLFTWLHNLTTRFQHPLVPYLGGPQIILDCGNTDGISKTCQLFADPWVAGRDPVSSRSGIICEEFCFTAGPSNADALGLNVATVRIDVGGICTSGPGGLEDVLENWDESRGRRPHLLYTVSSGHNPTGCLTSSARRKEVYELCCKYDVIIMEDEPYWYLQYSNPDNQEEQSKRPSSGFPFLDSLVPSYLSIDREGRVVRLDSFSKTIAPGCRLGWITAQPAVIERLERLTENSTQQPSGFVQSMVAEMLMGPDGRIASLQNQQQQQQQQSPDQVSSKASVNKAWDVAGWVTWLEGLRDQYKRRMELMCTRLDKGQFLIKTGRRPSFERMMTDEAQESDGDDGDDWSVVERTHMYRFDWPAAGMYVWVEMLLDSHPLAHAKNGVALPRLAMALWQFLTHSPYLVLAGPGTIFGATNEVKEEKAWRYFRFCFTSVDEDTIKRSSEAFGKGCADFWRIKDKNVIEELLREMEEVEMADDEAKVEMMRNMVDERVLGGLDIARERAMGMPLFY